MKIKDILNNPDHPIVQDVIRDSQTQPDDILTCIKCKKDYVRGVWDFYSLCPKCFYEFDAQKMAGRFFNFNPANKDQERPKYFEDAREWVKSLSN